MFKVVYSLISTYDDYYPEQLLISSFSMKKFNPFLTIILITDDKTLETLTGKRTKSLNYIDEIITVEVPYSHTNVTKSRFIKTKLRQIISGDFLYIDNDTIVLGDILNIDNFEGHIGGVPDLHKIAPLPEELFQKIEYLKFTGKKSFETGVTYFNGGVLYVRDTEIAHTFFDKWHNLWWDEHEKYGTEIDQPTLNHINFVMGNVIKKIDDIYNVQILRKESLEFLFRPKIIHYFKNSKNSLYYAFCGEEKMKEIRDKGITHDIEEEINNWYKPLIDKWEYLYFSDLPLISSPMEYVGGKIGRVFPWTNKIARYLYRMKGHNIKV